MAVVRKARNISSVTKKPQPKVTARSTRQPSSLEEMGDINFGALDDSKDNLIVSYDSGTDKFVLVSADEILATSAEDSNLNDPFVTQLEQELNLNTIALEDLDGGSF